MLIEGTEHVLNFLQFLWDLAFWDFLEWPVTTSKDFYTKIDASHIVSSIVWSCLKIIHHLAGFSHIFEHSLNLRDNIVAALNLKFSDHRLFSFVIYRCLIQKSGSQERSVRCNENISSVKAAENSNNLIKNLINFDESLLFEPIFELVINKNNNIMWCLFACVHKFLERSISSFLEKHIVIERTNNQVVNLFLEGQ